MPAGTPPTDGPLTFAAVARLELDELLDVLIARAHEVKATQGRLRALLAANHHVVQGLELGELLRRVADSARFLVGARFAVIGVLDAGHLGQVVATPDDRPLVELIRALPDDTGVLGYAVDDPRTVRLDDLAAHPRARPEIVAQDPPMRSFLRVPLRVGENSYGNLYLADRAPAMFTAADEQLVAALAATASMVLENASLLDDARRRERWQGAATALSTRLLSADTDLAVAWRDLLELAVEVADADGATISTMDTDDADEVEIVAGVAGLAAWEGRTFPSAGSITRAALEAGGAIAVPDTATDPRTAAVLLREPRLASIVAAPLVAAEDDAGPRAVLTLTRAPGADRFGPADARIVSRFATQAATALRLSRSRRAQERLERLEQREHLLGELNDTMLTGLMRISLAVLSVASRTDPGIRALLMAQVDELDRLSRRIRDTVLDLPSAGG